MTESIPFIIFTVLTVLLSAGCTYALFSWKYHALKIRTEAEHATMKRTGFHPLICNGCKYRNELSDNAEDQESDTPSQSTPDSLVSSLTEDVASLKATEYIQVFISGREIIIDTRWHTKGDMLVWDCDWGGHRHPTHDVLDMRKIDSYRVVRKKPKSQKTDEVE